MLLNGLETLVASTYHIFGELALSESSASIKIENFSLVHQDQCGWSLEINKIYIRENLIKPKIIIVRFIRVCEHHHKFRLQTFYKSRIYFLI